MNTEITSINNKLPTDSPAHLETFQLDQEKVDKLADQIQISDSTSVMSYGVQAMHEISNFADSLLNNVRAKDAGIVGQQLSDLMIFIKENSPLNKQEETESFLSKIPLIGKLFSKANRIKVEHQTITAQVDAIAQHLDKSMVTLLRDIEVLDQLYIRNFDFYKEALLYITAGKQKLNQIKTVDLIELQQKAEQTKDMMDAQKVKDLMSNIDRFERRIQDLEISKIIAVQNAPQIRIIQSNSQQLAEKIQGSILTTLPFWKNQIVIALSLDEQSKAARLQKEVSDTTNELLRKNAEMLQQNSIATAKEVERSIVDIETLRDIQNKLVTTIEETIKISTDARAKRAEAEKELATMEDDLRNRLTAAVSTYK